MAKYNNTTETTVEGGTIRLGNKSSFSIERIALDEALQVFVKVCGNAISVPSPPVVPSPHLARRDHHYKREKDALLGQTLLHLRHRTVIIIVKYFAPIPVFPRRHQIHSATAHGTLQFCTGTLAFFIPHHFEMWHSADTTGSFGRGTGRLRYEGGSRPQFTLCSQMRWRSSGRSFSSTWIVEDFSTTLGPQKL